MLIEFGKPLPVVVIVDLFLKAVAETRSRYEWVPEVVEIGCGSIGGYTKKKGVVAYRRRSCGDLHHKRIILCPLHCWCDDSISTTTTRVEISFGEGAHDNPFFGKKAEKPRGFFDRFFYGNDFEGIIKKFQTLTQEPASVLLLRYLQKCRASGGEVLLS